jgi:hypothetical protein
LDAKGRMNKEKESSSNEQNVNLSSDKNVNLSSDKNVNPSSDKNVNPSSDKNVNPSSDKNWERLIYELFEVFFAQIVPGGIAVFLYGQPWADKVTQSSSFISALMFLILAWVAGITLNIVSLHVPKLFFFSQVDSGLKPNRSSILKPNRCSIYVTLVWIAAIVAFRFVPSLYSLKFLLSSTGKWLIRGCIVAAVATFIALMMN